jgi:hypothetical protein
VPAAYLNGGLGIWELAFCALLTFLGYRGLQDYRFIRDSSLLRDCGRRYRRPQSRQDFFVLRGGR